MIELFLKYKANVNLIVDGNTALSLGSYRIWHNSSEEYNEYEVLELLLKAKGNPNLLGVTPPICSVLTYADNMGTDYAVKLLKLFKSYHADFNVTCDANKKTTPLHVAASVKNGKPSKKLIGLRSSYSADPNLMSNEEL